MGGLFHGTGATSATLTWTHVATPTTLPVFSIAGTSATDVWAVAHDTGTLALNTSKSSLIHYAGPPADPADPMNGWTEDPTVSAVSGQLSKIWFAGPNDLWVGGGTIILKSNRQYANPLTWRRTVDTDGVGTWTQDVTLAGSFNNALLLGAVALDADRILAFGKSGGSPTTMAGLFNHWGTWTSSSAKYTWKSAFAYPTVYNATCSNQVHYGGEAFAANDIWLYGEYGRLCHYDGTAWTVAAVSLEQVPFTKAFFGSWASANEMWVVGQDIAIHKQRTVNP